MKRNTPLSRYLKPLSVIVCWVLISIVPAVAFTQQGRPVSVEIDRRLHWDA